jgi:type II secretory ATPase GspE/PulE/Tfp pilus assembly ATPase PilB-like protein
MSDIIRRETIQSADQLPKVVRLINDDELIADERAHFAFGETFNGRIYGIINYKAPAFVKNRMQTIRTLFMADREVIIINANPELISIFRDQAEYDSHIEKQNDVDLDKRFIQILTDAITAGASDIHFEIGQSKADIRFRIHGMLHTISQMDTRTIYRLVNYIYNVAAEEGSKDTQFNVDEMQNALLDRHILINDELKHYKIRLQTAPCYPNSLTIVMRILPIDNQLSLGLNDLGYDQEHTRLLQKAQIQPSGVTIIAGTTGSGKSTTLATLLAEIHRRTAGTKKILTTEDPPEYTIRGANQINLSAKEDVQNHEESVFVRAIKVAMRCDPDIIMVGEVRDSKSSALLSSAVVSGHQVFTTVHAASAMAIIDRLIQLEFDRHILTSPGFLSLLVYQTLAPILCDRCRIPLKSMQQKSLSLEMQELMGRLMQVLDSPAYHSHQHEYLESIYFANQDGCDYCRRGYIGRTVFAEMVSPDSTLLQHFRDNNYDAAIRHWRQNGGKTVLEHGIEKMLKGVVDPRSVEDRCGYLSNVVQEQ